MNFRRSGRSGRTVGRAEAERLLDPTGTPSATDDPLARLLAAAAGPARPGELAGEQAAVAAFRAVRAAGVPGPAATGRRRRRLTTGVVAWIAALAATATAGVAFAAVTRDHAAERAPDPAPSSATATATGSARPTPHRSGPDRRTPPRRSPSAPGGTPSAPGPIPGPGGPPGTGKVVGQCRAYLAMSPEQRVKVLTRSGFAGLVAAAGGADRVGAYCRDLVPGYPPTGSHAGAGVPPGPGGGPGRKN
ncbi:hypothetical protein GA0070216_116140 [Micromonospora matsumotoense]|uniref:Uncharacterized protein n=1 Tax=Micromonospora matsumotoense TaxID=121616 RepID=A0A1C5AFG4_9ACTN|nr:hypothetical protein [Micromonospora matsumotoense]SCF43953.1 hypothetical protein GA0070216_116140 [Micromonospora matsumotoense]